MNFLRNKLKCIEINCTEIESFAAPRSITTFTKLLLLFFLLTTSFIVFCGMFIYYSPPSLTATSHPSETPTLRTRSRIVRLITHVEKKNAHTSLSYSSHFPNCSIHTFIIFKSPNSTITENSASPLFSLSLSFPLHPHPKKARNNHKWFPILQPLIHTFSLSFLIVFQHNFIHFSFIFNSFISPAECVVFVVEILINETWWSLFPIETGITNRIDLT